MARVFSSLAELEAYYDTPNIPEIVERSTSLPLVSDAELNDSNLSHFYSEHEFVVDRVGGDTQRLKVRWTTKKPSGPLRVVQDPFDRIVVQSPSESAAPYQKELYSKIGTLIRDFGEGVGDETLIGVNFTPNPGTHSEMLYFVDEVAKCALGKTWWAPGTDDNPGNGSQIRERIVFVWGQEPMHFADVETTDAELQKYIKRA